MVPIKSEAQRRLMHAAANKKGGVGGVSQKVGKEFAKADPGGKLPSKVKGYASGGLIETRQAEAEDWTDNIMGRVRRPERSIRDPIERKPSGTDKQMERVTTPDLHQGSDKYAQPDKYGDDRRAVGGAYAKGGKVTTKRAGDRNMTSKGKPRLNA